MSAEAVIPKIMLTRLRVWAEDRSPPIDVALPNVTFSVATREPYLELAWLPNATDNLFLSGGPDRHEGFLQATVCYLARTGLTDAMLIVEEILEQFPKGLALVEGDIRVRVPRRGWASPPMQDTDRVRIPVSIPYLAFA